MSFAAALKTRHAFWSLFAGKRVFKSGEKQDMKDAPHPTRRRGHGGGEHGFE
jgi:hypothetical protein